MKITIQYFDGCPHWQLADARVRRTLEVMHVSDADVEYQLVDSPEAAEQVGFHGSPTILIDGRDPFLVGNEPVGLSCRVFQTEAGPHGGPTEAQLQKALSGGNRSRRSM
ncbi:MAG TPA: thioredoxin family protein [Candidatus Dormibacteraeota bacterium]|nr:thioredoxin family protein [Candidatus Dormibacteraeota bacterium]